MRTQVAFQVGFTVDCAFLQHQQLSREVKNRTMVLIQYVQQEKIRLRLMLSVFIPREHLLCVSRRDASHSVR